MLVIALAIAGLSLTPAPEPWTLDVPLELHAQAPVGNIDTVVEPWIGIRLGRGHTLAWDAALFLGGHLGQGTAQVSSTKWIIGGEARALYSQRVVRSTLSRLSAYGFVGAGAGGGATHLTAFDDARVRPLFTWHTRIGGGGELRIQRVVTRLELAVGLRDLRLEISSALAIGIRF